MFKNLSINDENDLQRTACYELKGGTAGSSILCFWFPFLIRLLPTTYWKAVLARVKFSPLLLEDIEYSIFFKL